ncbi:MAG: hypothetical protein ACLFMM_05335 [Methanohalobium sp.]|uniref:hypothetical protein n=1 Tax=Methanohalobium sp. TaxID=2837493 RepID=UPI00397C5E84
MDNEIESVLNEKMSLISNIPIIQGYYLVIGGGKIGSNFVDYARTNGFPFVLILDINRAAPAAKKAVEIQDKQKLVNILKNPDYRTNGNIYFYNAGLEIVPFILSYGIPEFIIPAVPYHAAAKLVSYYANSQNQNLIKEISIVSDNSDGMKFFEQLESEFPKDIVAGKYPEHGIIMLSYARKGEICPDNCMSPEGYCPNFNRVKLKTITQHVKDLTDTKTGWVFESYQMKQGIGGLKGEDFKIITLDIMGYVKKVCEGRRNETFFIATTCNCHGVVNLFSLR